MTEEAAGSPDPLILLPGMGCTSRLWAPVERELRMERPDLDVLHHLLTEGSIDECVEQLLGQLPTRFALAGLSLGGIVAMALVRRAPERVSRLCLLSTSPRAPRQEQYHTWAAQRAELSTGRRPEDLQLDLLPALLHAGSNDPALRQLVLEMAAELPPGVFDRQLKAQATRIDERPALERVSVPTLVVAADADALCSVAMHEEIRDAVPDARLVVLDGVGHLATLEAPRAVAEAMSGWLDGPTERRSVSPTR